MDGVAMMDWPISVLTCTTGRIIMKINLPEASRHINGLDSPGVLLKVVLQISWTYLSVPLSASFKNT